MNEAESSTNKFIEFRKALVEIFDSENGQKVIEFLQESYVDVPVVDKSTEITFYRLGQKEFVQGLIKDTQMNVEDLENLVTGG